MKFTGVIYYIDEEWIVILENKDFRFQEKIGGEGKLCYNSNLAKMFGKKKFSKIVTCLLNFVGNIREFEINDECLTVVGLSFHCDGKIHETGYDEILWGTKTNNQKWEAKH